MLKSFLENIGAGRWVLGHKHTRCKGKNKNNSWGKMPPKKAAPNKRPNLTRVPKALAHTPIEPNVSAFLKPVQLSSRFLDTCWWAKEGVSLPRPSEHRGFLLGSGNLHSPSRFQLVESDKLYSKDQFRYSHCCTTLWPHESLTGPVLGLSIQLPLMTPPDLPSFSIIHHLIWKKWKKPSAHS